MLCCARQVDYGRSLIGDPELAKDVEKLIRTTIREYHLAEENRTRHSARQNQSANNPAAVRPTVARSLLKHAWSIRLPPPWVF